MLDWIRENYAIISLLINFGMLVVWITYLHVFYRGFQSQRSAKIIVNCGISRTLDGQCLISNMSAEPIYVESIIAGLKGSKDEWSCPVTDVEQLTEDEAPSDPRQLTRQGPLLSGAVMTIGSFRNLVDRVLRESGQPAEADLDRIQGLRWLEIQVIADYGSEDLLVAAKRRFNLEKRGDQWFLRPATIHTEQIGSRSDRRRISRVLEETL